MSPARGRQSFLALLDQDQKKAETKYIALRQRIVFYLRHHLAPDPEDGADEVLARVLRKLDEGAMVTTGLPNYCFGVARNVARERSQQRIGLELTPDTSACQPAAPRALTAGEQGVLIGQFLGMLTADERNLLLAYFQEDRVALAARLSISPNNLRIRIYKILQFLRSRLQDPGMSKTEKKVK
jgi:DNA-directed RNA polymerase specialized sigma24 family protein